MWSYQGRQMQTEKVSCMYRNWNHAETGGEQIFRLRLRLFSKKIISAHGAPAGIYGRGLFVFPALGFPPLLKTSLC
jgi:hypothetical protein